MAILGLTVLALGLGTSAASAGSVVTAAGPQSAAQGSTITIAGSVSSSSSCPTGAPVQLTSTGSVPGTNLFPNGVGPQVPRDAMDNFKATFVIPATTPVGSYTIGVTCGTTAVAVTQVLDVTPGKQVKPSITVSPTSAAPGDTVTISGVVPTPTSGTVFCPSGDATQLTSTAALFPPAGFGPQVSRDATGNFHTTYTIPASTALGTYTIGVRCGGGNVGVTATLKVATTAATTTTAPSTTTTTPSVTTTLLPAPVTTVPSAVATTAPSSSTTAPSASGKKKNSSSLRWVALGVLALVVLAVTVVFLAHRRGAKTPV